MNEETTQLEMERTEETPPEPRKQGRPKGSKTKHAAYVPTGDAASTEKRGITGRGLKELRLPLNDAGNVNVEAMREDTLQFARQLLSDPSVRQSLGLTEEQVVQLVLTDEDVRQMFTMMGSAEIFIATRFRHIPTDIAEKHLPFNKAEVDGLMGPTKALAAKYIPAAWLAKKDEAAFLFMMVMLHRQKWADATAEAEKRAEIKERFSQARSSSVETREPEVIT